MSIKYYKWVNTARGIGMFLVVLGHAISDTMLKTDGSFVAQSMFDFIYSFHMPLFFFFLVLFLFNHWRYKDSRTKSVIC